MHELFELIKTWYQEHLNYGTIAMLMAIESSFIPFPSEIVIPPAVILLVSTGQMDFTLVVLFATLGCLVGALINYYIGYTLGRKIIYSLAAQRWARLLLISPEKIQKAEAYFIKNGNTSTFIGRLVPGIRQLISIPAGMAKMDMKSFLIYTTLGSGLWNLILALISYFLGEHWEVYYKEISYVAAILGAIFVGYLIYKAYKKNGKKVAEQPD